ncbi:MAG: hypothetical protein JST36_00075 [Bacteroidetes bacterium]|nr:hypothetical protein [Bacteroidota bacterium]
MLPNTIADVITTLEAIIDTCAKTNNRLGYFACMYHKVTCRVKQGIDNNEFEDNARMERLDVIFANRYILAWQQYEAGQTPTKSWDIAFRAGKSRQTLVLQHLLLGMNAHINLDLGIAATEAAGSAALQTTRSDFNAINGILALLTGDILASIRRVSPLLSLLGLHATRYNSIIIQFSISNARDGAWCFADELHAKDPKAKVQLVQKRDWAIAELANGLTHATGLMRLTLWFIHLFEWKNPRKIIALMRSDSLLRVVKADKVER